MLLEDQYGVGDVVDIGEAGGTVEAVGLRITRLRDARGVLWYVRNGEIIRVGNKSQGWAQVDGRRAGRARHRPRALPRRSCRRRPTRCTPTTEWADVLLAAPESLGVEDISTAEGVVMRLQVRTHQRRPVAGRPGAADAAHASGSSPRASARRRRVLRRRPAQGPAVTTPHPAHGAAVRPRAAGDVPRGLRRPRVPAAVRHVPAVHRRRRAGPRRADRAGLPAHLLAAALGADLRHRPPAVAARRPGAVRAGRPAAPAPGADRRRRRPRRRCSALMAIPGTPLPVLLGAAVPGVAVRAAVRVGPVRAAWPTCSRATATPSPPR